MFDLPIHPLTGLRAIGVTKRGRPIWPVIGGSEDAGAEGGSEDADSDESADVKDAGSESREWWQFSSKDDFDEKVNEIVEKRLSRERKKFDPVLSERDTLKAEVERLKPLEDATKTDAQRWESEKSSLAAELDELRSFKSKAERNDLVREIADDKGLPPKLQKWVSGDDADAIAESVDELLNDLSEVGPAKKPAQRKPKETDGDAPGDKGFSGGGGGNDDGFSVDVILEQVRKNRGNTYAH